MALPPETKVPSIPNPAIDPEGFLRAVQEVVQVREGARGNPLDRGVTFRDLVDAGLAAPNPAFAGKGRIPASALITPTGAGGAGGALGTGVRPAMTVPPKPRDVVAVGTFTSILIAWAQPDYSNHAHAEILRAAVNDIGQAVAIGSSVGRQYADAVGTDADYYYWVRYVSTGNVKGPASASVRGKTALDPQYVMANLLSTTWQPNTAYTEFQYVRPTVDNGLMYRCTQDGTSGATEPVWPTVIGGIRTDGTVKWTTVAQTERVPFTIGTVNGQPAVVMDTAYIADATITVAKIKDAFLDNLTAIHGTLNFARIEQGNIFELTIGGDIKSEVFSPFNNTGFIIRNEPGRDPTTPGIREYVAEFYGDTLFSGDIRAARILGGIVVGNVFGIPSDADNGSFEYISIRDVVSDSVSGSRSDSTASRGILLNYDSFNSNGPFKVSNKTRTDAVFHYSGGAEGYTYYFLSPFAGLLPAYDPPLITNTTYDSGVGLYDRHFNYPAANFPIFAEAKVRTNPLQIISCNANAPFNYNRYRHKVVTARIDITRDCTFYRYNYDKHPTRGAAVSQTTHYARIQGWMFTIYKGNSSIVVAELFVSNYQLQYRSGGIGSFTVTSLPKSAFIWYNANSARLVLNTPSFYVDFTFGITPTSQFHGGTFRPLIRSGSFFIFKSIQFEYSLPEGLSLEVSCRRNNEMTVMQSTMPAGLDIGFTFSSVMDNNL